MPNWNPADGVPPGLRPPSGETQTVAGTGDRSDTGDRPNGIPGSAPGMGVGLMAHEASGPIHLGHKNDKHHLGETLDGEPINSAHLSVDAYFYDDRERDAPLYFEGDYPQNLPGFPLKSKVHLTYDPSEQHAFVGDEAHGMWKWWAEVPYLEAPKTPPPPPGREPPPTTGEPGPKPGQPGPSTPGSGGGPPTTGDGGPPTGGGGPPASGDNPNSGGGAPAYSPPAEGPSPMLGQFTYPDGGKTLLDRGHFFHKGRGYSLWEPFNDLDGTPKYPGGGGSGPATDSDGDNGKSPDKKDGPGKGGDDDSGDGKQTPPEKKEKKTAADHIHAWGTVGDKTKKKQEAEEAKKQVLLKALAAANLPSSGAGPGAMPTIQNGTSRVPAIVVRNATPYFWDPSTGVYRGATIWRGPGYGKSSGREVSSQGRGE